MVENMPARKIESAAPVSDHAVVLENVGRRFRRPRSSLRQGPVFVDALKDVSLTIPRRSSYGIVGESGSGKTTMLRLIAGLETVSSGSLRVDGIDLSSATRKSIRPLRKRLQVVFQDPMASLNPRMRIGQSIAEPLRLRGERDTVPRVAALLERVGLPSDAATRFPNEFSGGQRQRISIARAIAPHPHILLADEAVSALDVTVRAQVLDLLEDLAEAEEFTLVFISHDLSVVHRICDRVAVLHNGRLVEEGLTDDVWTNPRAEYTQRLLQAVPTLEHSLAGAKVRANAFRGGSL